MTNKDNPSKGSLFKDFLKEEGLYEEVSGRFLDSHEVKLERMVDGLTGALCRSWDIQQKMKESHQDNIKYIRAEELKEKDETIANLSDNVEHCLRHRVLLEDKIKEFQWEVADKRKTIKNLERSNADHKARFKDMLEYLMPLGVE